VAQFDKEESRTRDYRVAKNATLRATQHAKTGRVGGPVARASSLGCARDFGSGLKRPLDASTSRRKRGLLGMTMNPHGCVQIVRETIDAAAILANFKYPADGAMVTFEGVVRDNSRGRRTLYLDYEAYEVMAIKEMNRLVEAALAQFSIRQVMIVHRVGRLNIGETSVLIAVASAHRAAAFDACRWLIDSLKRTVPIWKKEHFEDGAVWADGQAFPANVQESSQSS
jgi:molybdopterin synthase catalytic subunit